LQMRSSPRHPRLGSSRLARRSSSLRPAKAESVTDLLLMPLNGALRNEELRRDLSVGQALAHQARHLDLAPRQRHDCQPRPALSRQAPRACIRAITLAVAVAGLASAPAVAPRHHDCADVMADAFVHQLGPDLETAPSCGFARTPGHRPRHGAWL